MSSLLSNSFVNRTIGAAAAAGTTYYQTHDWRATLVTFIAFAAYGYSHAATNASAH